VASIRTNVNNEEETDMAKIDVKQTERDDTYQFEVTVQDRGSQTRHRVTLSRADYERLAGGDASPVELVTESFRFLLEREPKESILRSFDLTVISRYFPEYEQEIQKHS
jgi:hypothetical protein